MKIIILLKHKIYKKSTIVQQLQTTIFTQIFGAKSAIIQTYLKKRFHKFASGGILRMVHIFVRISMFFVSDALAEAESTQSGGIMAILPMVGFVIILYFLLIRPQQKRQKQHQQLIASIKKGDKVVTNSGIIATVSKIVSEHEVVLEIANGIHCRFVKSAISNIADDADKTTVVSSSGSEEGAATIASKKQNVETQEQEESKPEKKAPVKKGGVSKKVTPKK